MDRNIPPRLEFFSQFFFRYILAILFLCVKETTFETREDVFYWTLGVSRPASYEITLARLSIRFLKIESLVFSEIVHDDSWPWYLVTEKRI